MTREEGEALVARISTASGRRASISSSTICELTEEQFLGIAIKHEVSPWQFSPNTVEPGKTHA